MKVSKELEAKCLELAGVFSAPSAVDDSVDEKQFQADVILFAKLRGWRHHHHYDARKSTAGWPDLVLVRNARALFVELKTNTGEVTPEQRDWIDDLNRAGLTACVWRPRDWPMIAKELA